MGNKLWDHSGVAVTLESAREKLAQQTRDGMPIYIVWQRSDRDGKGGNWNPDTYNDHVELVGTTEKCVRIKGVYDKSTSVVRPLRMSWCTRIPKAETTA